jgi:tetratricopeptide (TPR) repeat protein
VGVSVLPALLAGLVFGIHPLQVENVAWVASRKTLLAGFFGVASVGLALRGRLGWAFGAFLVAAASKGTAVVVPLWIAAAFLLGFWARRPGRRELAWLALFGVLAALRAVLSASAQEDVVERTAVAGLAGRLTIMGPVLATQLRQLVIPIDLGPIYPWPAMSLGNPVVWIGWGIVLLVALGVFFAARRSVHVALFGAFAGLGLLPTLNLWPAPFLQADRYLHLSMVGFALLLVRGVQPFARVAPWIPAVCVVTWWGLLAAPLTVSQTRVWRTSETLWGEVLRRDPEFADAYANLGEHLLRTGDPARARPPLRRALDLRPDHPAAGFNLALLDVREGNLDDAGSLLARLAEDHPDNAPVHGLLGRVLSLRGQSNTALRHLNRALALDPALGAVRFERARIYARAGKWERAASDLESLVSRGQGAPEVLNDLAAIRLAQGRPSDALPLAREAVDAAPGFAAAWDTLGTALLSLQRLDEAEEELERGLAANPDLADLHYHLAQVYELRNDPDRARAAAQRALEKLGSAPRDWRADARRLAL